MKKLVIIFAVFAVIAVVITGCSRSSGAMTIKKGVLMVGMEIGYPPMEYMADDGRTPIGFDVSMARALADRMGLQVEFVDTAWDGIFAAVNTRKFDCIISSVTINPARLAAHNFSKPYIQNTLAIVLPKNSRHQVRSPQDLAGLGVAYQEETTSDDFMTQLAQDGLRFTPYEYDKVMYCFDELSLGRVDVIVTDLLVAYEYLARSDSLEIVWQGGEEEFGICMRKGNDALTTAIDNALDSLFQDGTMLRISREIFDGMDLVSAVRR
jgi:polar amino acid transport system substrate-binding protein